MWFRVTFTDYCKVCNKYHTKCGNSENFCFVCQKKHKYYEWQYSTIETEKGKKDIAVCGIYAIKVGWSAVEKIKSRTLMPDGTVLTGMDGIRARERGLKAQDRYRKS